MKALNNVKQETTSFKKFSEDGDGVVMEQDCTVSRFCGDGPDV